MTIRDQLKRKVLWCYLGMLLVIPLFFLVGPPRRHEPPNPYFFLAMAPFFGLGMYMTFGIKCPKCQTRVGMLASQAFAPLVPFAWMKPTFNNCPGCGISLDTKLDRLPR
jgi:hypothetical protein